MSNDDIDGWAAAPPPGGLQPYQGAAPGQPSYGQPTHGQLPPGGYGTGMAMIPQPYKDTTVAWLLWLFLSGFGGHDFYLRRTGAGITKVVLTVIGLLTSWLLVGFLPLFAVFVWWIVDAATMSGRLRQVNAQIHAHNRAVGAVR